MRRKKEGKSKVLRTSRWMMEDTHCRVPGGRHGVIEWKKRETNGRHKKIERRMKMTDTSETPRKHTEVRAWNW